MSGLTSPPFIASLALLLLNDLVLKTAFHNAVTGKLSDIAGLIVFPLFWSALAPRRRLEIVIGTGVLFIWWKSSLSQPVIELWNSIAPLTIGRTVDYTDLLALVVLPFVYFHRPMPNERRPRWLAPASAALCVVAFGATSRAPRLIPVPDTSYTFPQSRVELLQRIYDLRLSYLDVGRPPKPSPEGPDSIDIIVPPTDSAQAAGGWRPSIEIEVRDVDGGSALRMLSARTHGEVPPRDEMRRRFEEGFVEPLRTGTPNEKFYRWPMSPNGKARFRPRIIAPSSLTEARDTVTISLARPAHVAIIELTPHDQWHLIYPAVPDDERELPAGTHELTTRCAREPRRTDTIPPGNLVGVCEIAHPVTTTALQAADPVVDVTGCALDAPVFPRQPVNSSGTLLLIAADAPLRREAIEPLVRGYCGLALTYAYEHSHAARLVKAARGKRWEAEERLLRR
ncbi:MAG TPA: hypothetical protein VJ672_06300 [Gemmatimonadaceae bacterium]|nr:hypothetical protein [Gemmatimonadaceae bacterium]